MKISYPLARILADVADARASAIGTPMAITIADEEGGLLLFCRTKGALPASTEISISKAYTAAMFRMSTEELGKMAQPGGMLYGVQHTLKGNVTLFGGGLPLRIERQVVGAVGISGGTAREDIQVAEEVCDTLSKMARWSKQIGSLLHETEMKEAFIFQLSEKLKQAFMHMNSALLSRETAILMGAIRLLSDRK